MSVLVDTSVWSLALRRRPTHLNMRERWKVTALRRLLEAGEAKLIGPIRQELLSGIRQPSDFEELRDQLRNFPDESLHREDYETAAQMTNHCTTRGLACSPVDVLICAVAKDRDWEIFSSDLDFERLSKELGVPLFRNYRLQ